jgi:hypothetical protein
MSSPFVRRKKAGNLGARLARFYLARSRRDHESEDFLVLYLGSNPQDEEVAVHWLHQVEAGGGLKEEHQDLAALIGEALPENIFIQRTLARFYLLLERTDFSALQTYRRIFQADESAPDGFIDDLARLLAKEGRADEWALEIYLRASASDAEQKRFLSGLAACVRWTPATDSNRHLLQSAHHYLRGFDAAALKKMSAGFHPPVPTKPRRKAHRQNRPSELLARTVKVILHGPAAAVRWIVRRTKDAATSIQRSQRVRRVLTGTLLCCLVIGLGALVVNTVSHLAVKETPTDKRATPAAQVISDPFTLQVAAYLKAQNAKVYVQQLKKRGVDAYWTEAVRSDKRWYQVRISHFATKQSARDYAEKLKSEGLIEDYYVANYRRPLAE